MQDVLNVNARFRFLVSPLPISDAKSGRTETDDASAQIEDGRVHEQLIHSLRNDSRPKRPMAGSWEDPPDLTYITW